VVTGCLVEAGAAEDVRRVLEAFVEELDVTRRVEVEVFTAELDEAGFLLQFPKAGLQPEPQYAEVRPQYPYYNPVLVAFYHERCERILPTCEQQLPQATLSLAHVVK
jgi:hypothetical protein